MEMIELYCDTFCKFNVKFLFLFYSFQRDQLSLLQKDIENLHNEREKKKKEMQVTEQKFQETISYWENQVCLI